MKIKHTVFAILLLFSLVPLYLFGIFMVFENNHKVEMILKDDLAVVSGAQITAIKNFCESRKESMEIIGSYDIVRDSIYASTGERNVADVGAQAYLDNLLWQRRSFQPFIISISIVSSDFRVVASSEEYVLNEDSDLRNVMERSLAGDFFMGDAYERETTEGNKRLVAAYQGIYDGHELIGYVVEEIEAEYFDQLRSYENMWEDGTLYILDGNNVTITAGSPGEDSREEFVLTAEEQENYYEIWNAIDKEANPSGEFTFTAAGDEYVTYYSNLDYSDWSIRVTENLSKHIKSTAAYRLLAMFTLICVTLLLLVINLILAKRLTEPIDRIITTLKKVQEDQDYTLRIANGRKDELGVLSARVNELLGYIEKENLQEKEQQRLLARKAERDSLTGVRNKKATEEKVQDMMLLAKEQEKTVVLGFLDIDDFKDYNTLYGHMEGDVVLQFVASVLHESVRGSVGRVGGDEFLFCMTELEDRASIDREINKIMDRLGQGFYSREQKQQIKVSCSLGVVISYGGKIGYSALLRAADEAMYQAKEQGKNGFIIEEFNKNGGRA